MYMVAPSPYNKHNNYSYIRIITNNDITKGISGAGVGVVYTYIFLTVFV